MKALLRFLPIAALLTNGSLAAAGFEVVESDSRIEIQDAGKTVFGWQRGPLAEPKGGAKFAGSAFVHPLTTPAGFGMTCIQPPDHLHHLGVWWPWKHLEVDGKKYNCWELQNGEGRQVAIGAKVREKSGDQVTLGVTNRHEVKVGDAYVPAVREETTLTFRRLGEDAYQLDLEIVQRPAEGRKVTVAAYRYSGFAWRGPGVWTRGTSRMRTSGGHDRDNANHQPARWVMVDGETPQGRATMLLMSAAARNGGGAELLRVWGSNTHDGMPFVNFNPVVKKSLPLSDPAVSKRKYRLVVADREILPAEAEERWQSWKTGAGD